MPRLQAAVRVCDLATTTIWVLLSALACAAC